MYDSITGDFGGELFSGREHKYGYVDGCSALRFRKASRRGDVSPSTMSGNAAEERTTPRPKGLRLFRRCAALARQARAPRHARCRAALLNTEMAAINVVVFMFTTT